MSIRDFNIVGLHKLTVLQREILHRTGILEWLHDFAEEKNRENTALSVQKNVL
jgi:hypothetical protein